MRETKEFKITDSLQDEVSLWLYQVTKNNKAYYNFKTFFKPSGYNAERKNVSRSDFILGVGKYVEARYQTLLDIKLVLAPDGTLDIEPPADQYIRITVSGSNKDLINRRPPPPSIWPYF